MEVIKYKKIQWLDIVKPSNEDLNYLKKKYRFHDLDLEDCLSRKERPKIDEYDNYLFIVLHFPVHNKRWNRYNVEELNIFLGKDFVITLHNGELLPLNKFKEKLKSSLKLRKEYLSKGSWYVLYELISELFDYCFPVIDRMSVNIKDIEREMFDTEEVRNLLHDIMVVKRNIITLRRILLPQRSVVAALEHKAGKFALSGLDIYFDDIVDKIEKLWSNLETSKEVVESLQDTNESLISHNINNVMKILTVFSVVMLPLTFITGLYGMNVNLPYAGQNQTFLAILLVMLLIVIFMLSVFRWNKWM